MKLHRSERDYYVVTATTDPPLTGTWEASFDQGATWIPGTLAHSDDGWRDSRGQVITDATGAVITDAPSWLVAGPDFDAIGVGQSFTDTDAIIDATVVPLLRIADNPVLDVERGPRIQLV